MAPAQAVATLKAGLLRQFGASAQNAIDEVVDNHVAAREGRLHREALDDIEHSVLASIRQRRKMQQTMRSSGTSMLSKGGSQARAQSASSLAMTPKPSAAQQRPLGSGHGSSQPLQFENIVKPPSTGGARAAQTAKSASESSLRKPIVMPVQQRTSLVVGSAALPKKSQRFYATKMPPFALSLTKDREDSKDSEESRLLTGVQPKYDVPLISKVQPMDHWDLIVAFDTELFRKAEEARVGFNRSGGHARRKAELDKQVEEKRIAKEQHDEAIRLEREECRAQAIEDAKLKEQEKAEEEAKREAARKNNEAMAQEMAQKRNRAEQKKKQECKDILAWLQNERERKAEELQKQRVEHANKCQQARDALLAAREEKRQRKLEEQEREMIAVAEAKRFLDEAEAKNRAAVEKRNSRVAAIAGSLGADVAMRDAEEERKLHEKIQRVLAEQDRRNEEDARNRKERRDRMVREMLDSLDHQIAERDKRKDQDRETDRRQVEIFRKQLEEQNEKQRQDTMRAIKKREELDQSLIDQMRAKLVPPKLFGLTFDLQRRDIAFNRLIYEHMAAEKFEPEFTAKILDEAKDVGKLQFFPSVGRSDAPIHPLELQVPDV